MLRKKLRSSKRSKKLHKKLRKRLKEKKRRDWSWLDTVCAHLLRLDGSMNEMNGLNNEVDPSTF